jgi:signal transduction histidine kinase
MVDEAEILDAWAEADHGVRQRFSKLACLWALLLIPAGASLDLLVYPHWFGWFFLLRLASDLVILGIFAAHFTAVGRRNARTLTFACLVTPQVAICAMIYLTEGFSSTYYGGLNFAILAMGIAMPVTVSEVAILAGLTFSLYAIAGFVEASGGVDYMLLYNHLFFMMLSAVISAIAVYFNRSRRFSEFRLNFQLNSRNQELAELDRVKSEFFANISHEFRTPLTLILAPLERLLQEPRDLPGRVARQLEMMRENGLRLLRLVNDLLDVIRLEEGQTYLERQNLRLDTLLSGLLESMLPLAEARGITLENRLADGPVSVSGDRAAIEKIFLNLLSNAIKFTPEGGQVVMTSQPHADSVKVTVADTGVGMDRDSLAYVFERFRQADSSTTRKYGGTGLGLALVKELTERHDGKVSISSEPGRGSSVSVVLPISTASEAAVDADAPELDTEKGAQRRLDLAAQQSAVGVLAEEPEVYTAEEPGGFKGRLLIVDDEPWIRRYLVDSLQDEYRILVAQDGKEGLEMTRRFHPELIILDLMLPEIDGLEVCRRIKQDPALRGSRIVLLTARAEEPSKLTALENGADDFLTKPFSSAEVRTRLRNLFRSVELELDLQRRNQELEETVGELRQTQNQLVHSEKLNALGRLAAGLLHEINNPLNYTLTALEFARNDPVVQAEAELKETLGDIDDGMQRIRGIVKELRAFAYPAKGEQTEEFQVSDTVEAALQVLAHEARDVGIDNRVEPGWVVTGSRNRVTQVVINLLSNAFKAMRTSNLERQGQVILSAQREDERVVLRVRDNGPGMSEETMERIFDPFYTTSDVGEGMGMGLSVCQTIIRNHGGELCVASQEGEWTEFSFDLMLKAFNAVGIDPESAVANAE